MVNHPDRSSTIYPPTSIANIFGNWLNGVDNRFKQLIRVAALAVIWLFWLCRNDKFFNNKNCLLCMLSTGLLLHSVRGHSCNLWCIKTYLWRSVQDWRIRRETFYPYMDGSIICGLALHLIRRDYNFSFWYVIRRFIFSNFGFVSAVCIFAMQRLGVILKLFK